MPSDWELSLSMLHVHCEIINECREKKHFVLSVSSVE